MVVTGWIKVMRVKETTYLMETIEKSYENEYDWPLY